MNPAAATNRSASATGREGILALRRTAKACALIGGAILRPGGARATELLSPGPGPPRAGTFGEFIRPAPPEALMTRSARADRIVNGCARTRASRTSTGPASPDRGA